MHAAFQSAPAPVVVHSPPQEASLTCQVLTALSDVAALAPDWHELLEATGRPEPMLSPAWLLTWWRVYGQ